MSFQSPSSGETAVSEQDYLAGEEGAATINGYPNIIFSATKSFSSRSV